MDNLFKELFTKLVELNEISTQIAEKFNKTNEQYYIEYENRLNSISIKDHNNI